MTGSVKRNILMITLVLAIITIPLENNLNSWAIVSFCIAGVIQQPLKHLFSRLRTDHYWKISVLFALWMAATWFWDSSGGFSVKFLEQTASFAFLPVIMVMIPTFTRRELMNACFAFMAAVVFVCLICLFRSAIEYYQTGDYRVFFYHYLGFQMGLNAIYLSNYCLACISWLAYHTFISPGDRRGRLPAAVAAVTAAFLLGMMFLLSSKMSLALAVLFILSFSIYIAVKKGVLFPVVLALLLAGSAAVMLAKNLHYLNWRISSTEFKTWSGPEDNNNGLAIRLTTWQSALELIRDRPLLGYGLKGANESLVAKFHEKKFEVAIPEKYNSHNQFLETTLKSGIVGLLLLLSLLAIPFLKAIRHGRYLPAVMVTHFVLVSMVEGTLEVQQELTFYWFFIFLFHYHDSPSLKKVP